MYIKTDELDRSPMLEKTLKIVFTMLVVAALFQFGVLTTGEVSANISLQYTAVIPASF
jgi:hypothetical protein